MKVLIADFDLFSKVGGGQTFYRSIIEKNPQIEFTYLAMFEPTNTARPANAHTLPFREQYAHEEWIRFCDVLPPKWSLNSFVRANNVAFSAAGKEFDVIDLPDYEQFAMFLRPALLHHDVRFKRLALSLHGRISTTIGMNWKTEGLFDRELIMQEDLQYKSVDLRYGLSKDYLDEWKQVADLESHYLSPLRFMPPAVPSRVGGAAAKPSINFIGRTEKRKGPDIFVDLAWWLPRDSYSHAAVIGPQCLDPQGIGSNLHLYSMANNRLGIDDLKILPAMNKDQMSELFASRAVTILPSRYDTFNLVATESLLAGCPTAIGSGAGVCRFLRETFPSVPFVTIDIAKPYGCIPQLLEILENYDSYRDRLVDSLLAARPEITGPSLAEIYESPATSDDEVRDELDDWYRRLMTEKANSGLFPTQRIKVAAKRAVRQRTSPRVRRTIRKFEPRRVAASVTSSLKEFCKSTSLRERLKSAHVMLTAQPLVNRYRQIHRAPERNARDLDEKVRHCGELISSLRVDRVRLWRELARIETLRGNDLVAVSYRLRAMRLAGMDRFRDLPAVVETLNQRGFVREALTADAMFGPYSDNVDRCEQLLHESLAQHQQKAGWREYELVDDRRERQPYKVSVIVSLYNAADKLPQFLNALYLQTLLRSNQMEVILIDSGSPSNEYAVFQQAMQDLRLPVLYARSSQRETIQSAWNRGIELAQGEYLSFLGVDEAVLPRCLERLAGELDADPALDWVQANSLVTTVDDRGQWLHDVMTYDRTDYKQSFVYLETCYLSWVGALYRRSIHDRFGYYDPTFAAAGDTEFKNRMLPFIKTKAIPDTLGVFWNYPSDRATCSPRAELEDLRAWYLHRTEGGVRYAFQQNDFGKVEELLVDTFRYRKSFCRHWSTDIEYASHLTSMLRDRAPTSSAVAYYDGVRRLLSAYRALDLIPQLSSASLRRALADANQVAGGVAQQHAELSQQQVQPVYRVFNDNRYEQHNHVWPTAA
jgi:glycosyltransferase involved in cell wall biosynthesis